MGAFPPPVRILPNRHFRRSLPRRVADGRKGFISADLSGRGRRVKPSIPQVARRWVRRLGRRFAWGGLALAAVAGCSREHYRVNADAAANEIVAPENGDPRW